MICKLLTQMHTTKKGCFGILVLKMICFGILVLKMKMICKLLKYLTTKSIHILFQNHFSLDFLFLFCVD